MSYPTPPGRWAPTLVPRVRGGRRYCIYDKYFAKGRAAGFETEEMAPILFYTGNESPHELPRPPPLAPPGLAMAAFRNFHAAAIV